MSRSFLALFVSILLNNSVNAVDRQYETSTPLSKEEVLRVKENDIVIGCEDAKHFIIEYSSLSCPHCANYYKDVFPKVKSEIVNKCKAKYIYRDFPTTRSALKGAAVVRCITTDDNGKVNGEDFLRLTQLLFNSQATWAFSDLYEENLSKILGITGVSQEKISTCMANKDLMHEIVSQSFISMKALNLSRSPAIFVDGVETPIAKFDTINEAIK